MPVEDEAVNHTGTLGRLECRDKLRWFRENRAGGHHAVQQRTGLGFFDLVVMHQGVIGLGDYGINHDHLVAISVGLFQSLACDHRVVSGKADQQPEHH